MVIRTVLEGDVVHNLVTALTAQGLQESAPTELRFDARTGTVVRHAEGHPRQWMRVSKTSDDFYIVQTLPTSLLDEDRARNHYVLYRFIDDILVRQLDSKQSLYRWMTLEEARLQLAAAQQERAAPPTDSPEERARWRSRWGLLADLPGTSTFFYNPQTAEIAPVGTHYEWAVPGWKLIVSWLQPGQPKLKVAEHTWDPIARRIHLSSQVAGMRSDGSATVGADGSVLMDMGGSRTRWRAGPDGSMEVAVDFLTPSMADQLNYAYQDTPQIRQAVAAMASERRQKLAEQRARSEAHRQHEAMEQRIAEREDRERLDQGYRKMVGDLTDYAAREMQTRAEADAMLARIAAEREPTAQPQAVVTVAPRPVAPAPATAPVPTAPAASETASGKPMRFIMMISMRNLPGDKVNSTCYSGVVTRDGPPGWGAGGFLPPGSGEQARQTVESLKSEFIGACEAGGRQISSAGNFNWVWNMLASDEAKFATARAKYREDVSVNIQ